MKDEKKPSYGWFFVACASLSFPFLDFQVSASSYRGALNRVSFLARFSRLNTSRPSICPRVADWG